MPTKLLVISASVLFFSLPPSSARASFAQQGAKLVGTGAVGIAGQGYSVALSADGNTAVVGGFNNNNGVEGAAWVYTRSGGVWSQEGAKLVGTGAVGIAGQGCSVALSADGNTAVVGGYKENGATGAAWVYTRSGGVWEAAGRWVGRLGAVGLAVQGWSVALSADGTPCGRVDRQRDGAACV
jgi:hypothetical protein